MYRDISGWIGGMVLLLFILVLYMNSSYLSIYERRTGYIYHPGTDSIYKIELAPALNPYKPWEPFIPFHSLHYIVPNGGEYMGKLEAELAAIEENRRLLSQDFDAWNEKFNRELEQSLNTENNHVFEYFDIKYFVRNDVLPKQLLPDSLSSLQEYENNKRTSLLAVDAVVVKRSLRSKKQEMKVLENALFIYGRAAMKLWEMGL